MPESCIRRIEKLLRIITVDNQAVSPKDIKWDCTAFSGTQWLQYQNCMNAIRIDLCPKRSYSPGMFCIIIISLQISKEWFREDIVTTEIAGFMKETTSGYRRVGLIVSSLKAAMVINKDEFTNIFCFFSLSSGIC